MWHALSPLAFSFLNFITIELINATLMPDATGLVRLNLNYYLAVITTVVIKQWEFPHEYLLKIANFP